MYLFVYFSIELTCSNFFGKLNCQKENNGKKKKKNTDVAENDCGSSDCISLHISGS